MVEAAEPEIAEAMAQRLAGRVSTAAHR
jgi:hypothetical protein